ncbi:hypothetical protein CS022_07525 [Veronia nyctiphanis]|uniref:PilZ domain-containing protein n=1 Tax=Veronia nyctiphanis TaxID=1278244 RepID=A0A4Q0YXN7_9GAMM|nr:PilZ domain-containing protein [Veronia nyctiphanis]RXJ73831.1 hypothetical protein CS022_07525 [Veronia nyctiphanis]
MTSNAHKYEHVVVTMLPHFLKPDFESKLDALSSKYSTTEVFMIKMEINRRMSPCTKRLDLRGRVPGEVREYEIDDNQCWLDDLAFNHYRKRVEFYGGMLTNGLWEELQPKQTTRSVLLKPNKQKIEPEAKLSAEYFKSGFGILRKESRYKFFATVDIILSDGSIVHGNTLDISQSGLKVKATAAFDYRVGDIVSVCFPELAKDHELPELKAGIDYQVTQIRDYSYSSHFITLGLKISEINDSINEIIDIRHRSKTQKPSEESNDKIDNIRHRALEKTVINHTTTLPLFLDFGVIRFALLTLMNTGIWNYWHNDKGEQFFSQLLSEDRLKLLKENRELIFYSFCHYENDQKYYVCAASVELTEEQKKLFWQMGANEISWRVFRLRLSTIEQDELKDSPTDMAALSHVVLIQELTDTEQTGEYLNHPASSETEASILNGYSRSFYNSSRISAIYPDINSGFADLLRKIAIDHFDTTSSL